MDEPLLGHDGIRRLREALRSADYTVAGVEARLGGTAGAALRAGLPATAARRLPGGDPQATLIRLLACGSAEPADAVAAALRPAPVADLVAAGILTADGDRLRAAVEIHPYGDATADGPVGDWWIVADLPTLLSGRPLPADHVLGVGGASDTLALATVREPVGAALDLGTGCGVQALHLSRHAGSVTATDVSRRALRFAATTAALSGQDWTLAAGDLAAPVAGRRFDLVVSNPPFIVGPAGRTRFTYRDSGRAGDAVCAELVAAMPGLLRDGGYAQFLANWIHPADGDWAQRVAGWLAGTGLDAWVVQREVTDPVEYVRLWQADTGTTDPAETEAWLDWFGASGVAAVGFGIVTLRAGGHRDPTVRIGDLRQATDAPFGALVPAWFARQDWLRAHAGPRLLDARLRTAGELTLHTESTPGDEGWAAGTRRLVLGSGERWVTDTDDLVAALVAGCRGVLPLSELLALLAAGHGLDPARLAEAALPAVAGLVERGILLPA